MKLIAMNDFFGTESRIRMTAHRADGCVASQQQAQSRWSLRCMVQLFNMHSGKSLTSATGGAGVASVGSIALAATMIMGSGSSHAAPAIAMRFFETSSGPVITADANIPSRTRRWVNDAISPQAKSRIQSISITGDEDAAKGKVRGGQNNVSAAGELDPAEKSRKKNRFDKSGLNDQVVSMAKSDENTSSLPYSHTEVVEGKLHCNIQLHGISQLLDAALGANYLALNGESRLRLRKTISQHEAAHCEMDALQETSASKVSAPFAQQQNEILRGTFRISNDKTEFALNTGSGIVAGGLQRVPDLDLFDAAASLHSERFADAKAILVEVRDQTRLLTSSSDKTDLARTRKSLGDYIATIKTLRSSEMAMITQRSTTPPLVYDHDTSPAIAAIEASLGKNAMAFAQASDFELTQIAGSIATATLINERVSLLQSALTKKIRQLKDYIPTEQAALLSTANEALYLSAQVRISQDKSTKAAKGSEDAYQNLSALADKGQRAVDALLSKEVSPSASSVNMAYAQIEREMPAAASALQARDYSSLLESSQSKRDARGVGLVAAKLQLAALEKALVSRNWAQEPTWSLEVATYVVASQDALEQVIRGSETAEIIHTLPAQPIDGPPLSLIGAVGGYLQKTNSAVQQSQGLMVDKALKAMQSIASAKEGVDLPVIRAGNIRP